MIIFPNQNATRVETRLMGKFVTELCNGLDTFKAFWITTLDNGSVVFDRWSLQSYEFFKEVWSSRSVQNAQTGIHLARRQLLESILHAKYTLRHYNWNLFIDTLQSKIIYITGNNFNRSHIYIGFAGLFLGSGVGFLIGISVKPSAVTVTHMKAVSATNYHGTESITLLDDIVTPTITESNQVMIMVKAAALDPMDVLIASGYGSFIRQFLIKRTLFKPVQREFPLILGRDCSGVVIDLGSDVRRDININDEVWVSLPPWTYCGALCETIVVQDKYVTHKPESLPHEQAATLPYSGTLAWLAVFKTAKLNPVNAVNKKICVYCGDTIVGLLLVQLCHYLKADVTVACPNRVCHLMKYLGANSTYENDTVSIDQLLSTAPTGYDFVFNLAGEQNINICKQLCNNGGKIIPIGPQRFKFETYGPIRRFIYILWLKFAYTFKGNKCWDHYEFDYKILNELSSMSNSYILKPVLDKTYMEHEFERAFRRMENNQNIGKVVIKFSNLTGPAILPPRPTGILF